MSGKCLGIQLYVQNQYPKAVYVHWAAHSLNLVVSTAIDIQPMQHCIEIILKMYTFLIHLNEVLYIMLLNKKIQI